MKDGINNFSSYQINMIQFSELSYQVLGQFKSSLF